MKQFDPEPAGAMTIVVAIVVAVLTVVVIALLSAAIFH